MILFLRVNGLREKMRLTHALIFGLSALVLAGCSHADSTANLNAPASQTTQSGNHPTIIADGNSAANPSNAGNLPAASGHRTLPGTVASPSNAQSSELDTSALDAKIKQAEAK